MNTIIIFTQFLLLVVIVVYFSNKLAAQADVIEQNSHINAAFIGIILALATSLPELATGITSVFINQPTMAISNVLGSNFFNTTIFAFVNLIYYKEFIYSKVKNETNKINYFVTFMYLVFIISVYFTLPSIITINITSIIILVLYYLSIKMIHQPQEQDVEVNHDVNLFKKAKINFVIYSCIILFSSMFLSVVAEDIMAITKLEASFVGAMFIGVSTSLPELTSVLALTKIKQYDLAASSVLGSNLFNFTILSIVDIVSVKEDLYSTSGDNGVYILAILGLTCVLITITALKAKSKNIISVIFSISILVIYMLYTLVGVL